MYLHIRVDFIKIIFIFCGDRGSRRIGPWRTDAYKTAETETSELDGIIIHNTTRFPEGSRIFRFSTKDNYKKKVSTSLRYSENKFEKCIFLRKILL